MSTVNRDSPAVRTDRLGHVLNQAALTPDLAAFAALPPAERDATYDNTAAVANSALQLSELETLGQQLICRVPCQLDLQYGPDVRQRFDHFPGQPGRPTLVFIHGGYWQMRHKNTFRGVVTGALSHGLGAALVGYTLAPQARLATIVQQVRTALATVRTYAATQGAGPGLLVSGWSAGAHLAALCLDEENVLAGVGISGIYDLAPIRLTRLNDALQLSDAEVSSLSPLVLPPSPRPFVVAHGLAELPALQAQSLAFANWRQNQPGLLVQVPNAEHFSILQSLARPRGETLEALLALI